MNRNANHPRFVVVCPGRSVCDNQAVVLQEDGLLRKYMIGHWRGNPDISPQLTSLFPPFALWSRVVWQFTSHDHWEWLRTAVHPVFDAWARTKLVQGDHVISSFGYANFCFEYARRTGGKTFVDAGNSHPEQFWDIITEEHKKWGIDRKPMPHHWNSRGRKMLDKTDYIFSPSSYVTRSFVSRGWPEDRLFYLPYPVDLSVFSPPAVLSPSSAEHSNRPLRVICTGSVSVRKGFPYLLEAMRIIQRQRPVILLLTDVIESSMAGIFPRYSDIPIDWAPPMPHSQLAERLRGADVFALLSLEDGFARTVTEAMACGLPVVVSENTGALDYVRPGVNGEIVPVCDPASAADAILAMANRPKSQVISSNQGLLADLSFDAFRTRFRNILRNLQLD